jgi:hypothetical protein
MQLHRIWIEELGARAAENRLGRQNLPFSLPDL